MKKVFLESHNLKNQTSGFGVFNHSLIKAMSELDTPDLEITLNVKHKNKVREEFGNRFKYHQYINFQRYKLLSIKKKFDVWHSMNQNTRIDPFFKQGKYILTIHDVNFASDAPNKSNLGRLKRFKEKLQMADVITYISEFAKKQTHDFFDVPKVPELIIYNGNPITEFLDFSNFKPEVPVDRPFFYSIGDFLEKKNFEVIVRMMVHLPDFNLIISGFNQNAYGEKIRQIIQENQLQNRVFMTGRVSNEAKQFYMKNCAAFFFPSVGEGFGLPPIEAMRFGTPVFLSTYTSLPEIGGEAAFYWDNFDSESMKEVVIQKLNEFEMQKQIWSDKLKERAAFFNWNQAAKQYLETYRM